MGHSREQNDHSFFAQQSLKYIDIGLPTLHEFWTIKILEFQLEFHEMNNIAALFKTIFFTKNSMVLSFIMKIIWPDYESMIVL